MNKRKNVRVKRDVNAKRDTGNPIKKISTYGYKPLQDAIIEINSSRYINATLYTYPDQLLLILENYNNGLVKNFEVFYKDNNRPYQRLLNVLNNYFRTTNDEWE